MKSRAERQAEFQAKKAKLNAEQQDRKAATVPLREQLQAVSEQSRAGRQDIADMKAASRDEVARRKASEAGIDTANAVMVVESHEDGRNSIVTVYPDRIERVKARSFGSISKANQDTEVIPIRQVSSVSSKKSGIRTDVSVHTAGNTIVFRVAHDAAQRFKDEVSRLVLDAGTPQQAAPEDTDLAARIRDLAELRDQGHLTDAEFQASKQKLLGL